MRLIAFVEYAAVVVGIIARITSYNVCYTKLLRARTIVCMMSTTASIVASCFVRPRLNDSGRGRGGSANHGARNLWNIHIGFAAAQKEPLPTIS